MPATSPSTNDDALLSIADAPSLFPAAGGGSPPSPAKIGRWARDGIGGVRLRTIRYGRDRFTCARWVREFGERLADPSRPAPTTAAVQQRRVDAAVADAARILA